ncbi:MAG: hypothetical protein BWK76_25775 [Desulfobulbaceae bacterium A2]|nr:MAG: hypothetical protein BWK76_25775 [Desulfobulbaceae bacterium A2]
MIPLSDLTLEDLLPHRGRSLYVTEVLAVDGNQAEVSCRVADWWPLQQDHGVHPLILVELAAQAAGVCNGWQRVQTQGRGSDQMGWLVGVKRADFNGDVLPVGATVVVRAENSSSFQNLREVACELSLDGRLIATIVLQLYQA